MGKIIPQFCTVDTWLAMSGMARRTVYYEIGLGNLRAVKQGKRTLLDVAACLAWLHSRPPAKIQVRPSRAKAARAARRGLRAGDAEPAQAHRPELAA